MVTKSVSHLRCMQEAGAVGGKGERPDEDRSIVLENGSVYCVSRPGGSDIYIQQKYRGNESERHNRSKGMRLFQSPRGSAARDPECTMTIGSARQGRYF